MQERVDRPKQRMVRKQVCITADQDRRLKLRASQSGTAVADVIRQGIELALAADEAAAEDWRSALGEFARDSGGDFEGLAERVAENKHTQSKLWRERLRRNRKLLDDAG